MSDAQVIAAARAAAVEHAGEVATRLDLSPPTQEDTARDRLQQLGSRGQGISPSAGAAEALIASGYLPVPLDSTSLVPSGPPLSSYSEALAHYFAHPGDGAGIELGARPGSTLVAARATPGAWLEWRKAHASETLDRGTEGGGAGIVVEPLFMGFPSTVSWSPPAARVRTSRVVVGVGAQLEEADSFMFGSKRQLEGEINWVVWSVTNVWSVETTAQPITFTDRRLPGGVAVTTSTVLPVHVVRPDRWTLTIDHMPTTAPMPPYLTAALGGKLGKA